MVSYYIRYTRLHEADQFVRLASGSHICPLRCGRKKFATLSWLVGSTCSSLLFSCYSKYVRLAESNASHISAHAMERERIFSSGRMKNFTKLRAISRDLQLGCILLMMVKLVDQPLSKLWRHFMEDMARTRYWRVRQVCSFIWATSFLVLLSCFFLTLYLTARRIRHRKAGPKWWTVTRHVPGSGYRAIEILNATSTYVRGLCYAINVCGTRVSRW